MLDYEISRLEEFDRDDFTVVYQPFTLNITNPLGPDGFTDWTLFAKDCFHISQKGNARGKKAIRRAHSFYTMLRLSLAINMKL